MEDIQYTFKRYEKKFLLTKEQYSEILPRLREKMQEDEYGLHTICNITEGNTMVYAHVLPCPQSFYRI